MQLDFKNRVSAKARSEKKERRDEKR